MMFTYIMRLGNMIQAGSIISSEVPGPGRCFRDPEILSSRPRSFFMRMICNFF
jgi:hypothetical protein